MAKKTKKSARPARGGGKAVKKTARAAPAAKLTARGRPPGKAKGTAAKPKKVAPVPAGMHSVTPNLVLADCAKALDFYKEAFGARELMRMASPDGKQIMHAEVRIGDSVVYMNDPMGRAAPSKESPATTSIWLYVPDSDALFERAVKAGATVSMPMMDAFWGDRMGMLLDPFGVPWGVATRVKDMSAEELREASEEFARKMAAQGGGQGAGSGAEPPQPQGALGEGVEPPQAQDA